MFHYYLQRGMSIKDLRDLTMQEELFLLASMQFQMEQDEKSWKEINDGQNDKYNT